jgi:hypothetical protein
MLGETAEPRMWLESFCEQCFESFQWRDRAHIRLENEPAAIEWRHVVRILWVELTRPSHFVADDPPIADPTIREFC